MQAGLSTLLSVLFAIPLARSLARRPDLSRAGSWLISLFAVPLGLPPLVAALGLIEIWGRSGLANQGLALFGSRHPSRSTGSAASCWPTCSSTCHWPPG
jgi:thiamine transport system permease protein